MNARKLATVLACAVALCMTAPAFAQNTISVQPEEYFAKTCGGPAVGMAAGTGTTYVCQNGFWVRADLSPCSPDPPSGICAGRPFCQSAVNGEIYYCPSGQWITVAAEIRGCDNCTEGPPTSLEDTLVRFGDTNGKVLKGSTAVLQDDGQLFLATPLGLSSGGTGATSPQAARAYLGAASETAVAHLTGDETIGGTKTFSGTTYLGAVYTYREGGIRRSDLFPSIASALSALPAPGGALQVGPEEDDPSSFVNTNPAGETTGRRNSLVMDFRRGGARFLSSVPEYPSGNWGAAEDLVPFVFQVRLDDPARVFDTDFGAFGEWNCSVQPAAGVNCPTGNSTWGIQNGNRQYWYSGQCNVLPAPSSAVGTAAQCSGPHIFEIRYPQQANGHDSKPIFAVGNGGAALYAPDIPSPYWRSYLTMFRGDDGGGEMIKANTPLYVFDKGGALLDGGTFLGNTLSFPYYTQHTYQPVNLWVQHDVTLDAPALVVEGTTDSTDAGETSPLARFFDRSGKGSYAHPGMDREAFGFYSNSRLYLGSYRDNAAAAERGQYIEWEGYTVDANTTRLRAAEPTGSNDVILPDRSGTAVVAPLSAGMGPTMWGTTGATGTDACDSAGLICAQTVAFEGGGGTLITRARTCIFVHTSLFMALCHAP